MPEQDRSRKPLRLLWRSPDRIARERQETSFDQDVLIIGAGPAGCSAARLLAPHRRVLILDRAQFPRTKVCGGALSHKTSLELERIFGAGLLPSLGLKQHHQARIYWQRRLLGTPQSRGPALRFVDRSEFDQQLLEEAMRAGARANLGEMVRQVDPGSGQVVTSQRTLRARILIAADGVQSTTCRITGLGAPIQRRRLILAAEVAAPFPPELRRRLLGQPELPGLYFGSVPRGYGWVFPRGSSVVIGVGGLAGQNRQIRQRLEEFLEMLEIRDQVEEDQIQGFPIAAGAPLKRPWRDRLLVVGEAAGLVDPILGEGIYFALRSGALAAQAVLSQDLEDGFEPVGPRYLQELRREIHPEIRWAERFRKIVYRPRVLRYLTHRLAPSERGGEHLFRLVSGQISYRQLPGRLLRRVLP